MSRPSCPCRCEREGSSWRRRFSGSAPQTGELRGSHCLLTRMPPTQLRSAHTHACIGECLSLRRLAGPAEALSSRGRHSTLLIRIGRIGCGGGDWSAVGGCMRAPPFLGGAHVGEGGRRGSPREVGGLPYFGGLRPWTGSGLCCCPTHLDRPLGKEKQNPLHVLSRIEPCLDRLFPEHPPFLPQSMPPTGGPRPHQQKNSCLQ